MKYAIRFHFIQNDDIPKVVEAYPREPNGGLEDEMADSDSGICRYLEEENWRGKIRYSVQIEG